MIYVVLREPTSSGFVNRLAFSDNDAIEVISCGGATIATQKGRLNEIGELGSEVNISQAQGAVAQGVEGSLAIVDWDGATRVSAEIYAGTKRFYGWSLAVARSDAPTAVPDWLWGDPDHCMVTDISTDGGTIGLTYGERWANDGRLLSFGKDGSTVPLVVGGHDVWVKTSAVDPVKPITYRRKVPSWYSDGPTTSAILDEETATFATSKVGPDIFDFECGDATLAANFYSALAAVGTVLVSGNDYSIECSTYTNAGTAIRFYTGSADFYAAEAAANVFISYPRRIPIAAGANAIRGFSTGTAPALPLGIMEIVDDLLVFSPYSQNRSGDFACRTKLASSLAWNPSPAFSNDFTGTPGSPGEAWAYNALTMVLSSGEPIGTYQTPANDGTVSAPNWLTIALGSNNPGAKLSIALRMNVAEPADGERYDFYVVDMVAKAFFYAPIVDTGVVGQSPFDKDPIAIGTVPVGASSFDMLSQPSGLVFVPAHLKFSSIDDLHGYQILGISSRNIDTVCVIELQQATIYGASSVAFGSASALLQPSAFPFQYAGYSTNDQLDRAAAAILAQTPHSTYLTPFLPSFVPAPADSGECMDASKTYIENAETLAKETWAIFGWLDGGYVSPGYDNQSAQGLGEIPQPPTLQIGRFEDVITEPVVEYCDVAGTLTKKAYIANVDQEYDATNSGKFFGGWGHEPLPETIQSDFLYYRWDVCPIQLDPMPASPDGTYGSWYYEILHGNTIWQSAKDYGYQIWQRCRAAWKVHHIKRGATFQFRGIYDDSVIGAMWWDAQRNGARRIDWLCLQPRYLTFSVREAKPLCWAGASVYIPGTLAAFAGYDVSDWDQGGGDTLVCVKKSYSLTTGKATYTVAIPPVIT